jgi:hypothetical protein
MQATMTARRSTIVHIRNIQPHCFAAAYLIFRRSSSSCPLRLASAVLSIDVGGVAEGWEIVLEMVPLGPWWEWK